MIKQLGIEYSIEPTRISDSVRKDEIDVIPEEGRDNAVPLIESIGIGGTGALAGILDAMGKGSLTPEQVAVIFVEVFGMTKEAADQLIQAKATPAPAAAPAAAPAEFQADQHKPTKGMIEEAKLGLEWRREYNRGGTEVGVARARDISNGKNLSDDTVKRMNSFFARHEVDKKGEGFTPGEDGYPSAGRIAWALWGGDAGQAWAAAKVEQINRNKKLERKTRTSTEVKRNEFGMTTGFEQKVELVMPIPAGGEEDEDFLDRCMADDTMNSEYPDSAQRFAVCQTQLKK